MHHCTASFPAFAHICCRLDQLVLPVARQTKHLSRPLPVFLVAIAREKTFVCEDPLQPLKHAPTSATPNTKASPNVIHTHNTVSPTFLFASAGSARARKILGGWHRWKADFLEDHVQLIVSLAHCIAPRICTLHTEDTAVLD